MSEQIVLKDENNNVLDSQFVKPGKIVEIGEVDCIVKRLAER